VFANIVILDSSAIQLVATHKIICHPDADIFNLNSFKFCKLYENAGGLSMSGQK
jgi:hypothetical protein